MMKKFIPILLLICLLSACSKPIPSSTPSAPAQVNETKVNSSSFDLSFSQRDMDSSYSENATTITLSDNGINVFGSGAVVNGNTVTVTAAGTYIVCGSVSNGQLAVEIPAAEKAQIVLKDAHISCADGPAVYIKQAEKIFLTLEGENTLADGSVYSAGYTEENAGAALYSKEDLAINGNGSLEVSGNYRHGITSKDDLIITGGNIAVTATEQGLHGKDCVKICNAALNINSKTDGIQSDNTEDTSTRGFIYIQSGNINISSGNDGLQAENYLKIDGGSFNITTNGENAADSMKGIKCASLLEIYGGEFIINSKDDAIHSNDDLSVSNAIITLSSEDDGLHADSELTLYSGNITVNRSYEGLEGNSIRILDGVYNITAWDDGLNSAGGNDASALNRPGENPFAVDESCDITIEGGALYINAAGDGIDSNGSLNITGGEIILHGPENGANSALDYASDALTTNCEFVAFGASQMAMNFNDSASQPTLMYNLPAGYQGGVEVSLKDEKGNFAVTAISEKSFSSIIISSAKLQSGKTYTLVIDGTEIDTITFLENLISNGGFGGQMPNRGDMQMPNRGEMQKPENGNMQRPDRGEMPMEGPFPRP